MGVTSSSASTNSKVIDYRQPHVKKHRSEPVENLISQAKFDFESRWINPQTSTACLADFDPLKVHSMTRITGDILIRHKTSGQFFTLKQYMRSAFRKHIECVKYNRRLLQALKFPFVTNLVFDFEDDCNYYDVLNHADGVSMFSHVRRMKNLSEDVARFYAAQIVLCVEDLHAVNLVYRDLKLENLTIDEKGYIKMTNFALAKYGRVRSSTPLCKREYTAPEMLNSKSYNGSVDWWALGIVIFEMVAGYSPFYSTSKADCYTKITSGSVEYPNSFSDDLKTLLRGLFRVDPQKRLGCSDLSTAKDIRNQSWFGQMDWIALYNKAIPAPFLPENFTRQDDYFDGFVALM